MQEELSHNFTLVEHNSHSVRIVLLHTLQDQYVVFSVKLYCFLAITLTTTFHVNLIGTFCRQVQLTHCTGAVFDTNSDVDKNIAEELVGEGLAWVHPEHIATNEDDSAGK